MCTEGVKVGLADFAIQEAIIGNFKNAPPYIIKQFMFTIYLNK